MNTADAVETLAIIKETMSAFKIPFWLEYGTLLGFVRENNFISFDNDIDIGIKISDWREEVLAELVGHGFRMKYRYGELGCGLEYSLIRKGIHVDFFFFYEERDCFWNASWVKLAPDAADFNLIRFVNKKFDLKQIIFHGMSLRVPTDEVSHLVEHYGETWRIPNPDWDWAFGGKNIHRTEIFMARDDYESIVYVDGVFDMFHRGHIELFKKARTLGGYLIVGVLSDEEVANYKRRPVVPLKDRAEIVRQCRLVDRVIVGSPSFVSGELLDQNRVDIVVHGDDNKYPDHYEVPIRRKIMKYVPYWQDCSTTSIIETVKTPEKRSQA